MSGKGSARKIVNAKKSILYMYLTSIQRRSRQPGLYHTHARSHITRAGAVIDQTPGNMIFLCEASIKAPAFSYTCGSCWLETTTHNDLVKRIEVGSAKQTGVPQKLETKPTSALKHTLPTPRYGQYLTHGQWA